MNTTPETTHYKEFLRIHSNKQQVKLGVIVFIGKDKSTHQTIMYSPSLELSGYGETANKAEEMFKCALDDFCEYLINLTTKKRDTALAKLGWKSDKLHNKEFSSIYVDINGKLQDFKTSAEDVEVREELVTI